MLAPVLSQIAEENEDIIVGKVNFDEEMALAQAFGIQSIPTVILFKDGKWKVIDVVGYKVTV